MPTLLVASFGLTGWWLSNHNRLPASLQDSFKASPEPMRWKLEFEPSATAAVINAKDPETLVRQIYQHLGEGERAQALDTARVLTKRYYSQRFERDALDLDHWWPKLVQGVQGARKAKPLEVVSVLHWNDGEETVVVTMTDPNMRDKRQAIYLRTYWQKEADQWKLVFEGPT